MSTSNPRQNKTARPNKQQQNGADPARRHSAWSGTRTFSPAPNSASPRPPPTTTFSPSNNGPASTTGAKPNNVLQSLSGLTGTTITISTKLEQRFEGVISATSIDTEPTGVTLKDVRDIVKPGGPLIEQIFIRAADIDTWASGPADAKFTPNMAANGDSFRTDTDISSRKAPVRERELQAWQPSGDIPPATGLNGRGDAETFGPGANGGSWDQFATNEKLFNVKTTFNEELYTTKLDRTGADFDAKQKKAEKIANEINGLATNNPHLAEERNQIVDDSGINEEDKYGAVVRNSNAYVPPGARNGKEEPTVSVTAPDGTSATPSTPAKPPADAFREFVTSEKNRLTQKRAALVKNDMKNRVAELLKFSQSFKLNKPMPEDLVTILAKDEDKQKSIREKSLKDAESAVARSIASTTASATPAVAQRPPTNKQAAAESSTSASKKAFAVQEIPPSAKGTVLASSSTSSKLAGPPAKKPAVNMMIPEIPPFKGPKSRSSLPQGVSAPALNGPSASKTAAQAQANAAAQAKIAAANKLNINASSFRPNPKAGGFTPGSGSPSARSPNASATASPRAKEQTAVNPFFGSRPLKRGPINIKEDFNPYKTNKVGEANIAAPTWQYSGKRYHTLFPSSANNNGHHQHHSSQPQQQPQQHVSPRMSQPQAAVIQQPPPPPYEEEAQQQHAAAVRNQQQQQQQAQQQQQQQQQQQPPQGGYVYYPQYAYGQMMPGMPPHPGYMAAPYGMQPMYNPMYAPPPGMQMPPPGAYMHPPPPGAMYAPANGVGVPGNGAGANGRPSPIPAHAHPYYQQSPQMGHAVAYPMMMPGPPPPPQQGYEQAVGMGGH